MRCENASRKVIDGTDPAHLRFVRLYFRPKTPTQWHNEGIRAPSERTSLNAHCPIPVFFCFDLVGLLSEDNVWFSDGNIGSSRALGGDMVMRRLDQVDQSADCVIRHANRSGGGSDPGLSLDMMCQGARPSKIPPSAVIATTIPASAMMLTNGAIQLRSCQTLCQRASRSGSRTQSRPTLATHSRSSTSIAQHVRSGRDSITELIGRSPSKRTATPSVPAIKANPRSGRELPPTKARVGGVSRNAVSHIIGV
jgi:hypothetical protein